MLEDNLKAVVKPQYVDQIPRAVKGPVKNVKDLIKGRAQMDNMEHIMKVLGMLQCRSDDNADLLIICFNRTQSSRRP